MNSLEKSLALKQKALALGYTDCGIIDIPAYKEFLSEIDRRNELYPHSAFFYNRSLALRKVYNKLSSTLNME